VVSQDVRIDHRGMGPIVFGLCWAACPWGSKHEFYVVCIYMRFPVQVCECLCHYSRVECGGQRKLFDLVDVERIVAEAEGIEP